MKSDGITRREFLEQAALLTATLPAILSDTAEGTLKLPHRVLGCYHHNTSRV